MSDHFAPERVAAYNRRLAEIESIRADADSRIESIREEIVQEFGSEYGSELYWKEQLELNPDCVRIIDSVSGHSHMIPRDHYERNKGYYAQSYDLVR